MKHFVLFIGEYIPAISSGLLLTLAFPDAGLDWLAWIALVPLMLSLYRFNNSRSIGNIKDDSNRKGFRAGFITGLCHFLSLIYWIVPTISTYGQLPLFLAVPILVLLSSYLALYPAVFSWGLSRLGAFDTETIARNVLHTDNKKYKAQYFQSVFMPLTAGALWVSLEYLRSTLFTGFPWGLIGYSQYMRLNLIQIADMTSVYGISFIIVLVNGAVAKALFLIIAGKNRDSEYIWYKPGKKTSGSGQTGQHPKMDSVVWIAAIIIMFISVNFYGRMRITDIQKKSSEACHVDVSVIQGNIEQVLKWDLAYQETTVEKYCRLSWKAAESFVKSQGQHLRSAYYQHGTGIQEEKDRPDLIVWPETALPFYYSWNKKMSDRVDRCIRDAGATFIIGSPAFKTVDEAAKIYNFYNRAYMVNKLGVITGSYDKVHLVPFGEYVPLGKYLPFLGKLTQQVGDFSSGKTDTAPLSFNGSSAGVLICFEVIFPYLARESVQNGAEILVTMTNDAWFGYTSAPWQHFTMGIFRAVENRRAVARAANTGISGFIDPTGKVMQISKLFEESSLTCEMPSLRIKTLYSEFGDFFAFVCMLAVVGAFVMSVFRIPEH